MENKKQKFLFLVQTGVIVNDIRYTRAISVHVLAAAMEIPEDQIPEDIEGAALKYLEYKYGLDEFPKPRWVP